MTNNTSNRSLRRSDNRIIAGVCSGIADYLGVDTALVRLVAVVLAVLGGAAVPIYLAAWLIMPDARDQIAASRIADRISDKRSEGRRVDVPSPYTDPNPLTEPNQPVRS